MDSRTNKIAWQRGLTGDGNYGALATAGAPFGLGSAAPPGG
jgi:hypothetical protein